MKLKHLILFLLLIISSLTFSQAKKNVAKKTIPLAKAKVFTYDNLTFDYTYYKYLSIDKIIIDSEKTLVYIGVNNINNSTPINLYFLGEESPEALVLQDNETKKVYKQINNPVSNLPTGLERENFTVQSGEKTIFIVAFERLASEIKILNLLDGGAKNWDNRSGTYWNIYGIKINKNEEIINSKQIVSTINPKSVKSSKEPKKSTTIIPNQSQKNIASTTKAQTKPEPSKVYNKYVDGTYSYTVTSDETSDYGDYDRRSIQIKIYLDNEYLTYYNNSVIYHDTGAVTCQCVNDSKTFNEYENVNISNYIIDKIKSNLRNVYKAEKFSF